MNMFGAEKMGELMDQGHRVVIKLLEFGCAAIDPADGGDHVVPQADSAVADAVHAGATGGQIAAVGFGGEGDDEIESAVILLRWKILLEFHHEARGRRDMFPLRPRGGVDRDKPNFELALEINGSGFDARAEFLIPARVASPETRIGQRLYTDDPLERWVVKQSAGRNGDDAKDEASCP